MSVANRLVVMTREMKNFPFSFSECDKSTQQKKKIKKNERMENSGVEVTLCYPVCGQKQPHNKTESHAASCANNTFIEVFESSEDENEEVLDSEIDSKQKPKTCIDEEPF